MRDENDQWIRVAVKKGGMIVLPAGMYHRFTLDTDNYIKVVLMTLVLVPCFCSLNIFSCDWWVSLGLECKGGQES